MEKTIKNVCAFNENAKYNDITISRSYLIRTKLNDKKKLSREEKNHITNGCNTNSYFKDAIPLQGWKIDFSDVLKNYIVKQYGQWNEYKAIDKTSLKAMLFGKIEKIVEIK